MLSIGFFSLHLCSQTVELLGNEKDTLNVPLENVNVLAIPLSQENNSFSITYRKEFIDDINSNEALNKNSIVKDRVKNVIRLFDQVEHKLIFDKNNSYFYTEKFMGLNENNQESAAMNAGGMKGNHYLNLRTKERIVTLNLLDQQFKICDEFQIYDWKLSSEVKTIGTFKVYLSLIHI